MPQSIENPAEFFLNLGGLHDADLINIQWDFTTQSLSIEIDDINSNLAGLPGYPGLSPCVLKFSSIRNIELRCDAHTGDRMRIYKLGAKSIDEFEYTLNLQISPGGFINLNFKAATRHDARLQA